MTITNPKRVRESNDLPPDSSPQAFFAARLKEFERKFSALEESLRLAEEDRNLATIRAKALEQELLAVKEQSKREIEEFFEAQSKLMDEIEQLYQENQELRRFGEQSVLSKVRNLGDRLAKRISFVS